MKQFYCTCSYSTRQGLFLLAYLACMFMVLAAPPAHGAEITAQLDPQSFTTAHPATLTITVSGRQKADITMPEVDDLVFHRRGQSSQFQMINGAVSSSVTYTFLVQGLKPGDYTIPPIAVSLGGNTHKTAAIPCSVTQASTSPGQQRTGPTSPANRMNPEESENIAFIKLIPEKTESYTGEIVPATIKAYFLKGIKVNLNSLPTLRGDGVLLNTLTNEPLQRDEVINDTAYTVLTWETALTGIKEGEHELAMEMEATMLIRSRQRQQMPGGGSRLFQDDIFDDFFARYENRPVRVSSPVVSLTTRELPENGKPEGFSGAIGTFTLDLKAHPAEIETGEPLTLTMTIEGSGNFGNVEVPVLSSSEGLKTYTPTSSFSQGAHPYEGRKIFEQAVVISDHGVKQIPAVIFSFFDPDNGIYQTLFSDPIDVTVKSTSSAAKIPPAIDSSAAQDPLKTGGENISALPTLAPIKLSPGPLAQTLQPLFLRPWFMVSAFLCILAIFGVSAYRIRKAYLAARPLVMYDKKVIQQRKELLQALKNASTMDSTEYLHHTQHILRDFLALLWQAEPASLTTADIRRRLNPDSAITELFTRADQAAYGAISFSEQERRYLHNNILDIASKLS